MLYTNCYGRFRLFQTTIKNLKVPHFKSTYLNRIQVITCSLATYKTNSTTALCWQLPPVIVLQQTQPTMTISIMLSRELFISSPRCTCADASPVNTLDRCNVPHFCLFVP